MEQLLVQVNSETTATAIKKFVGQFEDAIVEEQMLDNNYLQAYGIDKKNFEAKTELLEGGPRAAHQRQRNTAQNQQNQDRSRQRCGAENSLINQLLCGVPRIDDRHDSVSLHYFQK